MTKKIDPVAKLYGVLSHGFEPEYIELMGQLLADHRAQLIREGADEGDVNNAIASLTAMGVQLRVSRNLREHGL